ncbi:hypothetical protein CEXT_707781 [Caerostris extrusa]|uniref:Uncharacterized protein n=1 Tax=Caerostris extrusa TaxID=172846 RepID=A0AAV4W1M6_CAEEX|nr:hypothetical protein CEXT_707781 [Caerostris extrusa]
MCSFPTKQRAKNEDKAHGFMTVARPDRSAMDWNTAAAQSFHSWTLAPLDGYHACAIKWGFDTFEWPGSDKVRATTGDAIK